MKPVEMKNPDVVLLPPEGDDNCGELHVKLVEFSDGSRSVMSIWEPSQLEREALAAGGNLVVYVPMMPPPPFALAVMSTFGVIVEE